MAESKHPMMYTFETANKMLNGRCQARRKIANSTWLERFGNDIGVRLHNTVVVLFKSDGSITLDSGGWKTVTTKDRMNNYSPPFNVFSSRGVWMVSKYNGSNTVPFADGIICNAEGEWSGIGTDPQRGVKA